jgi:hypothetical protein
VYLQFLHFKIENAGILHFKLSALILSTLILKSPPYRQTLSFANSRVGAPQGTHQSVKKSTSTTSFVFIVVSKFDLSKYCIIYSKILICVIAFYLHRYKVINYNATAAIEIDICYVVKRLVTVIITIAIIVN